VDQRSHEPDCQRAKERCGRQHHPGVAEAQPQFVRAERENAVFPALIMAAANRRRTSSLSRTDVESDDVTGMSDIAITRQAALQN
jgi:hypothetical protein